ncbi:hypothetical protein EW093_12275 [Thiospirochaeta perfilievii]|uniref:Uncharacterized protein n=1 Tax=Thiospirochaeta perfilievii TaxID=252967 RepID=A0A5C1QFZ4_9SPIO|nr:DUF5312 family protein [Thiospirochaeta perfilievii]QEN05456.1 hypothetical protein EW093_12275 [Thiospirochaeta perfilievii]
MLADLIEKIMTLIGGKDDPNSKNKKLIKEIKKSLKKSNKLFNVKKDEVTSTLAQFFYNLYKIVGPFNDILSNIDSSKAFKRMIVESYMSEKQLEAVDRLTGDEINKRLLSSKNVKLTASQVQKEIIGLVSSFSSELTNQINESYNLLLIFRDLSCFNYYFLLKKFDSRLPNYDFVYKPSFSDISASYVSEDLKDFLEILQIFNASNNWKEIFVILEKYRSNMSIDIKSWNKVLRSIQDIKSSNILLNIVKVVDENPYYEVKSTYNDNSIVEDYIKVIRDDAEEALKGVLKQKKEQAIGKYIEMIFGDVGSVERNKYYTKHANITYEKKELEGYTYVDPINYLRAYFLDYFKTETKPVIEVLLIQGQWATHVTSQEFSEAFHKIQEFLPKTIELDSSLADEEPVGARIKTMLRKSGKDMIAKNALDSEIKTVNKQAKIIVEGSVQNLIILGNVIKAILEEFKSGKVEAIINWKELQNTQEEPLEEMMLRTYKKLFYMVQLIQQTLKGI